jgi:hypothetical protein
MGFRQKVSIDFELKYRIFPTIKIPIDNGNLSNREAVWMISRISVHGNCGSDITSPVQENSGPDID